MTAVEWPEGRSFDRRRGARVQLAVPVQMHGVMADAGGVVPRYAGQTVDLSTNGTYVTTGTRRAFAPGEILLVSIGIPWEFRSTFPFSRVVGSCRIVRIDQAGYGEYIQQGVGLAFCGDDVTFLGAIVAPT